MNLDRIVVLIDTKFKWCRTDTAFFAAFLEEFFQHGRLRA